MPRSNAQIDIRNYGATELARFATETHIVHCGSRGATEARNVQLNVDHMLGAGAFRKIRSFGSFLQDGAGQLCSDPTQKYILVVPNEVIDGI